MATQAIQNEEPMFRFRVLIERDSRYNVYVARCLETGSVAASEDPEVVEDMIKELLIDEVTFALGRNNLSDLYSSPAPFAVWMKYRQAEQGGIPSKPMSRAVRATNEEVPAEIKIARSR